ncbi:hypothetical protein [Salibacterium aidingense]|uniref:hypothetical protein n=1 Tax=Salibacterium aidingense TaxID=384933 RepID=UPI0004063DAC|nr:hypothetical protein [Salibacterium aidingense]
MGRRRAEDPLGKAILFTKLAEVVPMESAVAARSDRTAVYFVLRGQMPHEKIRTMPNSNGKCKIIVRIFI